MISSTVVADFLKDSWRPRALGYSNLATKTHPFVLDNFPTQTQISVAIFEVQRVHPDAGHVLEFSVRKTWSCLCKLPNGDTGYYKCPRMAVGKSWQLDPKNGKQKWDIGSKAPFQRAAASETTAPPWHTDVVYCNRLTNRTSTQEKGKTYINII